MEEREKGDQASELSNELQECVSAVHEVESSGESQSKVIQVSLKIKIYTFKFQNYLIMAPNLVFSFRYLVL